jgi:hypothetical protein
MKQIQTRKVRQIAELQMDGEKRVMDSLFPGLLREYASRDVGFSYSALGTELGMPNGRYR